MLPFWQSFAAQEHTCDHLLLVPELASGVCLQGIPDVQGASSHWEPKSTTERVRRHKTQSFPYTQREMRIKADLVLESPWILVTTWFVSTFFV